MRALRALEEENFEFYVDLVTHRRTKTVTIDNTLTHTRTFTIHMDKESSAVAFTSSYIVVRILMFKAEERRLPQKNSFEEGFEQRV